MNSIRILFFLLCTSAAANTLQRTTLPPSDTSAIEWRSFDKSTLEKLKNNPELSYTQAPAVMSLWERFKIWLKQILNALLRAAATTNWVAVLIVTLALIAIIYVAMRLLKVDPFTLFYKTKAPLKAGVIDEDIHSLDFENLIHQALQHEQYRQAIRLVFLQALKLLSDHHYIHWQPGKTNHDYLQELTDVRLRTGFNELNFYFEYAWYGNFTITSQLFNKVSSAYANWKTNL